MHPYVTSAFCAMVMWCLLDCASVSNQERSEEEKKKNSGYAPCGGGAVAVTAVKQRRQVEGQTRVHRRVVMVAWWRPSLERSGSPRVLWACCVLCVSAVRTRKMQTSCATAITSQHSFPLWPRCTAYMPTTARRSAITAPAVPHRLHTRVFELTPRRRLPRTRRTGSILALLGATVG